MSGSIQPVGTASMTVASGAAGVFPTATGYYPPEGSRVVSAQYNWTAQTGYVDDLSQLVARGVETTIQSAYIDNSQCAMPVTVTVAGTDQVVVVPAFNEGVYPLLFTGTPQVQLSVAQVLSGAVTRVYYINFPLGAASWGLQPGQAAQSVLNVTASQVIKPAPGRLVRVVVTTALTVAAVTFNDCTTVAAAGASNTVLTIPSGTAAGAIFDIEWPCALGIVVAFPATGAVAVSFV